MDNTNSALSLGASNPLTDNLPLLPGGPIYVDDEYLYQGFGPVLSSNESAVGTNRSIYIQGLGWGDTRYGQVRLPAGWTGYQLTADVYGLYDNISWIEGNTRNGNFESGTTSPNAWSYTPNGLGTGGTNPFHGGYYGTKYGETDKGVRISVNWTGSGTPVQFELSDYAAWFHNGDIGRDDPVWAKLSFDVRYNHTSAQFSAVDNLAIYVEVDGKVYRLNANTTCPLFDQWYHVDLEIPYNDLLTWSAPGPIPIRLGLSWNTFYESNSDEEWTLDFDNVVFKVKGKADPENTFVNLEMNQTQVTGLDYGLGRVTRTGTWSNPTSSPKCVVAEWQTNDLDAENVEFFYNLTLDIQRNSSTKQLDGTAVSVHTARNTTTVYWIAWFYAAQPTYFSAYNFNLTKPTSEWSLHKAINPLGIDRSAFVTDTSTELRFSSTTVNEAFGWWNITLTSTNRIRYSPNGIVTNLETYRIGQSIQTTAYLTAGTTSGEANLTIYMPNGSVLYEPPPVSVSSTTVNFPSYSLLDGDPAGVYTICVTYDNDISHDTTYSATRVGFRSKTVIVEHSTSLSSRKPEPMQVIYEVGEYFYPQIEYLDTDDTNAHIHGATVNTTWGGQPFTFYESGGFYEVQIPADLVSAGSYSMQVDASKNHYDSKTIFINIDITQGATLDANPPLPIPYGDSETIIAYYRQEGSGTGIDGAAIVANWTGHSVTPQGGGRYDIDINSAQVDDIGTYRLNITANHPSFERKTLFITVVVRERYTQLTATPPTFVPIGEISQFDITISDLDDPGTPPTNSSSKLHIEIWRSGVEWKSPEATISPIGPGQYQISINTSFLVGGAGSYQFEVKFLWYGTTDNKPFYSNQSINVFVGVRQIATIIDFDQPSPAPWGEFMNITLYYSVNDPASSQDSDPVPGLTEMDVTCTLNGSSYTNFQWYDQGDGYYYIYIPASDIDLVGLYTLFITVTHSNLDYQSASRSIGFQIIEHQTQTIVIQPYPTAYGQTTDIVIQWTDLATGSSLTDTELDYVNVYFLNGSEATLGETSLIFTLDTSIWNPKTSYELKVYVYPSSDQYLNSSGILRITVLVHQTAVAVDPPDETPYEYTTNLTIHWFDLTAGGEIDFGNVYRIIVSGPYPDQIFTGPFSDTTIVLDTSIWAIGSHSLTVTVEAYSSPPIFYDASGPVTVVIRRHLVTVVANPPSPVAIGESFILYIDWYDVDLGVSIGVGELQRIHIEGNGTYGGYLPDDFFGSFDIPLSTATWSIELHQLNVTVFPNDTSKYKVQWDTVLVILRKRNIIIDVRPIPSIPFQNDTYITLFVNDSDDDQPLVGQIVQIRIEGFTTIIYDNNSWNDAWNISAGEYRIPLPSSTWPLGTHDITITVTPFPEYKSTFTDTKATIRPLATSFTRDPLNQIPYNENGNITVHFQVEDSESGQDGTYIDGTISIDELIPAQYTVHHEGTGNYIIEIHASALGTPGQKTYTIRITVGLEYDAGELIVSLQVRKLLTALIYNQVVNTPFGDNIEIRVYYIIFDGESSDSGKNITGAEITLNGLGGLVLTPSDYTITPDGGSYLITITKSILIGTYQVEVFASDPSVLYFDASIETPPVSFSVRTLYSQLENEPVDDEAYGEMFNVTLFYSVRDDASSQNGDGILNADQLSVESLNGSWTINLGDWSFLEKPLKPGFYFITIDSTSMPNPGRYRVRITIGFSLLPPTYEGQSIEAWVICIERPTRITNTFPPDTGFGNPIIVYLNFTDIVSDWGIDNSTTGTDVRIRVLNASTGIEITATYWIETYPGSGGWSEPTFYYRLFITASELGAVNIIFDFIIEVTWAGTDPFYETATAPFSVRTVGTPTVLFADAIETQPTGDNITIILHYETDVGVPIDNSTWGQLVGIEIGCELIPSWDHTYWWVDYGHPLYDHMNGVYVVIIDGSKNLDYGSYIFNINMTWPTAPPTAPYYAPANLLTAARVRKILTTLDWSQPDTVYWSQNLTIKVKYWDYDHDVSVPSPTFWSPDIMVLGWVMNPDGTYNITIDTTSMNAGPVSFYLNASSLNYASLLRDIDILIAHAPLILTYAGDYLTSTIVEPWGTIITVSVYIENGLTGAPVTGELVDYKFYDMTTWGLMTENVTGNGFYYISLDTGPVGATGTQLIIQADITNFELRLLTYTVSILPVDTVLDVPLGSTTVVTVIVDTILYINVSYWSLDTGGNPDLPINDADVVAYLESLWLANLTFVGSGIYRASINTTNWMIQPYQIIVSAQSANSVHRSIPFTVNIAHKPTQIVVVEGATQSKQFNESVSLTIFLNDTQGDNPMNPILGHTLVFDWGEQTILMTSNGTPGFYTGVFFANRPDRANAYIIPITHEAQGKYGFSQTSIQIFINPRETRVDIISAESVSIIDGAEYRIPIPFGDDTWYIPINETLEFVVLFVVNDTNLPLSELLGARGSLSYKTDFPDFIYNSLTGYWTIQYRLTFTSEASDFTLTFSLDNFETQLFERSLVATEIPVEIVPNIPIRDLLFVGEVINFTISVHDMYHDCGVNTLLNAPPVPGLFISVTADPDKIGNYTVIITGVAQGVGELVFSIQKENYQSTEFRQVITVAYSPETQLLITVGSAIAIILIFALIMWTLWARVFSIPWEVRRMRKLAKQVERDEEYSLGKKDLKRFRERDVSMSATVKTAMSTIDVPLTPAMIPVTEEVEEITATEEDIMAELDKIPGLGPEEKAVLAEEMKKIPRKDRIWFLNDLRRQMGKSRMDFLTKREEAPPPMKPDERPPKKPAKKPAKKPPAKEPDKEPPVMPIEEVKPVEPPPPDKALEGDRTAPTVVPPEERVTPHVPSGVEIEIRRELDKIPGLSKEEKQALVDHLKYLSKEERQATYFSLRQSADED